MFTLPLSSQELEINSRVFNAPPGSSFVPGQWCWLMVRQASQCGIQFIRVITVLSVHHHPPTGSSIILLVVLLMSCATQELHEWMNANGTGSRE